MGSVLGSGPVLVGSVVGRLKWMVLVLVLVLFDDDGGIEVEDEDDAGTSLARR